MYIPENVDINCGIYRIVNKANGKFYVGSTKNAKERKKNHFNELKKGVHHCDHLQRAWNKAEDKSVFEFNVFIFCKESDLIALEQSCINTMNPAYNTNKIAGKPPVFSGPKNHMYGNGKKSFFYGKPAWNKTLPREQQPNYGKKASPETKEKLRVSHLGKPTWNKNIPWGQEAKTKLSLAKKGKSLPQKSLLTENQALEILQSMEGTLILAEKYGVSRQVIANLRMGKTWRHLPRTKVWSRNELCVLGWTDEKRKRQGDSIRGVNHRDAKLTEADVLEIRASNARHVDLAKKYNVSACAIIDIRQGKTWKHLLVENFFDSPAESQPSLDWPSKDIPAISERFAKGDIL